MHIIILCCVIICIVLIDTRLSMKNGNRQTESNIKVGIKLNLITRIQEYRTFDQIMLKMGVTIDFS